MKFTDHNSRSLKYTLLFASVSAFSFIAAYCLTGLAPAGLPAQQASPINHRQLFKNYRFLNFFLSSGPSRPLTGIDTVDRDHPLLAAIARLRQAEQLLSEKKYELSSAALAAIPGEFPYLAAQRDELQLRSLYAAKKFKTFLVYQDSHRAASLETKIMLQNCLLRDHQAGRAQEEFKLLFANRPIASFRKSLPAAALSGLLGRLDEDFWFAKFSFLLKTAARGEFRQELPFCRFRALATLFKAEFAYQGRDYPRCQALLQGGLGDRYQPFAEKILLKIALRSDAQTDILGRLQAIGKDSPLYPELLHDAAQILLSKREFARALPMYSLYLEECREQDEEYWKTVWLLAWIYYRQDRKAQARLYFEKGCQSPLLSYQIASRYWLSKLEDRKPQPPYLYPFSYYAVRVFRDKAKFRTLGQAFIASIAEAPSARFVEISADIKVLAKYGLWDDCLETIRAAKSDPLLNPSDLNLLKISESLVEYRQNRFYQAFASFRGNFKHIEYVRLPNFLSGIFFPRQYLDLITAYSREYAVDPYLVQALIREESFFRADSLSPARAFGLMQLLQSTARQVAKGSALKVRAKDLYDPETNISLGLQHLKSLLDKYDGRLYLALAAYNAGVGVVDQWLTDFPDASEEEFIEMIPYSETRNYVKNILRNYFFYRYYYETGKA
ncbi:MAG: lytic transglycosylase domain-containing protein [Candidatus Aminicenantes bacterium]|nr:lytic transglycosylase domain-containing protein [Candidatus Aminicenantes bacterium]